MIKEELNLWSGVDWVFQSTHLCFHAIKTQPRLFQPLNELDMFLGVSCELILSEKLFALFWFLLVNQNIFTWQAFLTYLCNHETFSKKTQRKFNETLLSSVFPHISRDSRNSTENWLFPSSMGNNLQYSASEHVWWFGCFVKWQGKSRQQILYSYVSYRNKTWFRKDVKLYCFQIEKKNPVITKQHRFLLFIKTSFVISKTNRFLMRSTTEVSNVFYFGSR